MATVACAKGRAPAQGRRMKRVCLVLSPHTEYYRECPGSLYTTFACFCALRLLLLSPGFLYKFVKVSPAPALRSVSLSRSLIHIGMQRRGSRAGGQTESRRVRHTTRCCKVVVKESSRSSRSDDTTPSTTTTMTAAAEAAAPEPPEPAFTLSLLARAGALWPRVSIVEQFYAIAGEHKHAELYYIPSYTSGCGTLSQRRRRQRRQQQSAARKRE